MNIKILAATGLFCGFAAFAQTPPASAPSGELPPFPADAKTLSADEMKKLFDGNTFEGKFAKGGQFRWQFNTAGFVFFNFPRIADSGKWSYKEPSRFCFETKTIPADCVEVRSTATGLALRRTSNNEIVLMNKQ